MTRPAPPAPAPRAGTPGVPGDRAGDASARAALAVFAGVLAVAFVLEVYLGRRQWFSRDEWAFLAGREIGDVRDLFRDHNTHWTTLPVVAYRLMWSVFGLRTYLPYTAMAVIAHLTCAGLLRVVMRRARVGPWTSTAAASLFALFGAGESNVVWGFQIAFTGALALGLAHLLLADHDGPIGRRDALGVACGIGSLACSGVGIVMAGAVTLAVLARRGWRAAAFHGGALAAVYATWWLAIGRDGFGEDERDAPIADVAAFAAHGLRATFGALGQLPGIGLVLAVLLVIGLPLAWAPLGRDRLRREAPPVAALALAAPAFLVVSGTGRVELLGVEYARTGRYVHVVAALLLPALAVALDAIRLRLGRAGPVVVVLLVVAIPGNVAALAQWADEGAPIARRYRHLILAIPRDPLAAEVPRGVRPDTNHEDAAEMTLGWLLDGVRSGRLPDPGPSSPRARAEIAFRLSFLQTAPRTPPRDCEPLVAPVARTLERGEAVRFRPTVDRKATKLRVTSLDPPRTRLVFEPVHGTVLTATRGPVRVELASELVFFPVELCRPTG